MISVTKHDPLINGLIHKVDNADFSKKLQKSMELPYIKVYYCFIKPLPSRPVTYY